MKKNLLEMTNKERLEHIKELLKNRLPNEEEQGLNITKVSGSMEDYIKSRGLIPWEEALARLDEKMDAVAKRLGVEMPQRPTTGLLTKKGRLNVKRVKKLSDEELRLEIGAWIKDELNKWESSHGKEKREEFLTMFRQMTSKLWG